MQSRIDQKNSLKKAQELCRARIKKRALHKKNKENLDKKKRKSLKESTLVPGALPPCTVQNNTQLKPKPMQIQELQEPDWNLLRNRKQLQRALAWAAPFCIKKKGTVLPVPLHSTILNSIFSGTAGKFLRTKLIRVHSRSYSASAHKCRTYFINVEKFNVLYKKLSENSLQNKLFNKNNAPILGTMQEIQSVRIIQNELLKFSKKNAIDVTTLNAIIQKVPGVDTFYGAEFEAHERYFEFIRKKFKCEIETGKFKMVERSFRFWHELQNMTKAAKSYFWKDTYKHNYDISAAAPSVLVQEAMKEPGNAERVKPVLHYISNKKMYRAKVQELTGLSLHDSKQIINSLFNGARLARNKYCAAFRTMKFNYAAMTALQNDPLIKELRIGIKEMWKAINENLSKRFAPEKIQKLKSPKEKWEFYFYSESLVVRAITKELRTQNIKHFTEHDGFRSCEEPNMFFVINAIYVETGYNLQFEKDEMYAN